MDPFLPGPLQPYRIDPARDPHGARLRRLLVADQRARALAGVRQLLVHLLAISGAGLWVAACRPHLIADEVRQSLVVGWAGFAVVTAAVTAGEGVWERRKQRALNDLSPDPK